MARGGKARQLSKSRRQMFRDTMNSNIPRHAIGRPGMSWDQIGELDPDTRHPMTPRASNPKARPRDMDAMGVDQALLYPTWFAEGFHLIEDLDVAYRLACAYNDWIADCCKAAPHRLFAVAMVPLQNMDYALEELRRVRAIEAFRAAFIRPMFLEGRYFTHLRLRDGVSQPARTIEAERPRLLSCDVRSDRISRPGRL